MPMIGAYDVPKMLRSESRQKNRISAMLASM